MLEAEFQIMLLAVSSEIVVIGAHGAYDVIGAHDPAGLQCMNLECSRKAQIERGDAHMFTYDVKQVYECNYQLSWKTFFFMLALL